MEGTDIEDGRPFLELSSDEMAKVIDRDVAVARAAFVKALTDAPEHLASIRTGCHAEYLLTLHRRAKHAIVALRSEEASADFMDDTYRLGMHAAAVRLFFERVKNSRDDIAQYGGRFDAPAFSDHELEVLRHLRHQTLHVGMLVSVQWGHPHWLADYQVGHYITGPWNKPWRIRECPECRQKLWSVHDLIAVPDSHLNVAETPLRRSIRAVFESEPWITTYAPLWQASAPFNGPRPTIFLLKEILGEPL